MNKNLIVLLLAAFFFGCTHTDTKGHSITKKNENLVNILIQHLPQEKWSVTYRTAKPVKRLEFVRNKNRFRREIFTPVSEGYYVLAEDSKEAIERYDGKAFTEVTFMFDAYYKNTPKDYEFFQKFGDGSHVLYTGHLIVKDIDEEITLNSFQFKPFKNEKILAEGQILNNNHDPLVTSDEGTYIYFGNIKPVESSRFISVIDPKLPSWIKNELTAFLPQIFQYYSKELGTKPIQRTFVFFNYTDVNSDELSIGGGSLTNMLQFTLSGKQWLTKSQERLSKLMHLLAHESAHVWNLQIFKPKGGDWIHEGSADAFAYKALVDLNIITKKDYAGLLSTALNECFNLLKSRPLVLLSGGDAKAHYRCGSTLAYLTEKAVKKQNPKAKFFTFWKQLFSNSKNAEYSDTTYYETLENNFSLPFTANFIKQFVNGPILDPETRLIEQLKAADVRLVEAGLPSKNVQSEYGKEAFRILMKEDCDGRYGMWQSHNGLKTDEIKECKTLRGNLVATHIGSFKVLAEGYQSLLYLHSSCIEKKSVAIKFTDPSQQVEVACPKSLPPLPPKPYLIL